jgi:hypothetical protein
MIRTRRRFYRDAAGQVWKRTEVYVLGIRVWL